MYTPIIPAEPAFDAEGTPYSPRFEDIYHSHAGALAQCEHVFLQGNQLPERWQQQTTPFTILETGFGLGLNFLTTWHAWQQASRQTPHLHFISLELHPFSRADLAMLHKRVLAHTPALQPYSQALLTQWPELCAGLHRLHFPEENLTLTLWFGNAHTGLKQLSAQIDAFYLDGFSPAKNPDMWSPAICYQLARLAGPSATLATWSVAAAVQLALRHNRFDVAKTPGFGTKREMLTARYTGRARPQNPRPPQSALILGAGAAGTSLAQRLGQRGWHIQLLDEHPEPAGGASGNHAGMMRFLPSWDDNPVARLTRSGSQYAIRYLIHLQKSHAIRWGATGAFQMAQNDEKAARMAEIVAHLQLPPAVLRYLSPEEATEKLGCPISTRGWWFGQGGWVQPHSLCKANLLATPHLTARFNTAVAALRFDGQDWHAQDTQGNTLAQAPIVILANGTGTPHIAQAAGLPVIPARGQTTLLAENTAHPSPHAALIGAAYISPAVDGQHCVGATFTLDDPEPALRPADQAHNLQKLDQTLPGFCPNPSHLPLQGRVGFRPVSPDRMPIVGAVPLPDALAHMQPNKQTLADVPRHPGLYALTGFGARGLTWATLLSELLTCQITGEPLPLERDLVDMLDPARYILRPVQRVEADPEA